MKNEIINIVKTTLMLLDDIFTDAMIYKLVDICSEIRSIPTRICGNNEITIYIRLEYTNHEHRQYTIFVDRFVAFNLFLWYDGTIAKQSIPIPPRIFEHNSSFIKMFEEYN